MSFQIDFSLTTTVLVALSVTATAQGAFSVIQTVALQSRIFNEVQGIRPSEIKA